MNRLISACLIGTGFEFFEFQIFAMLMPILVGVFFSPTMSLNGKYLSGYLLFAVAFFARLMGAMMFGFVADHKGRRQALLMAMWIMALSTGLLGLLPGYQSIGFGAWLLLLCCRLGQGLSLGGEFSIGSVLLFENQKKPRCVGLIWQDLGGTLGLLLATLLVVGLRFFFDEQQLQTYAWRFPFFTAFLLSLWVICIRKNIKDPALDGGFLALNNQRSNLDYSRELTQNWPKIALLVMACAPNGVFWYLQVMYIPNQLLTVSPMMMLGLIMLTLLTIPLGAWMADKLGLYQVWGASVMGLVVNFGALILYPNSHVQYAGMMIQAVLLAVNQGPRLLILNTHFPLAIRALACSVIYSSANIAGGVAPFIFLWVYEQTHQHQYAYYGMMVFAALSMLSMWRLSYQRHSSNAALA